MRWGGVVHHVVATTTYETQKSVDTLQKHKLTLHALTTGKQILAQALAQGILSSEEKIKVDQWFENPQGWAQEMGISS